jgi:hypothetical protein
MGTQYKYNCVPIITVSQLIRSEVDPFNSNCQNVRTFNQTTEKQST